MNVFEIILRMVAISTVLVLFIWTWAALKRIRIYTGRLDEAGESLQVMIDDAGDMINELNRLSDYIITRLDVKNSEIWSSLKKLDSKVDSVEKRMKQIRVEADRIQSELKTAVGKTKVAEPEQKKLKVIPISPKYREVLKLASNGYSQTDIAKKLSIGKGETKLVLDLNK